MYSLRPKRLFHHSTQSRFSASFTLELGFRRRRMKDSGKETFPGPFSNAPPDRARSRKGAVKPAYPEILRNRCVKTMKHRLTHNRQSRTRSQYSIIYPKTAQVFILGHFVAFCYSRSDSSDKPFSQILSHLPGSSCHRNQENTFFFSPQEYF